MTARRRVRGSASRHRKTRRSWHPDLGALFALCRDAPDEAVRKKAACAVAEIVAASKPIHSAEAVEEILRSAEGTLLDPFLLSDSEMELAVAFVSIGLSRAHAQKAVRVVSSATIGRAGGLVIGRDLSTRYVSRSILEGKVRTPWDLWHFAPGESTPGAARPMLVGRSGMVGDAFVLLEARGFAPFYEPDERNPAVKLRDASALAGVPLQELGVSVGLEDGVHLCVGAETPESIIRVVSALGRGRVLRIGPDRQGGACLVAYLKPTPPAELERIPLAAAARGAPPWLHADLQVTPPSELVVAAARVGTAPLRWLESLPEEELVEAFESR